MLAGEAGEVINTAAQFANIYLLNGLRELTIGLFIDQHEGVLTKALSCERIVSEPHVPWQVTSPDPAEKAINPDLFMVRADGSCDVFDLKLPLLDRSKLTKGKRNRRRFVDAVGEGIAQLAHYREFFSIEENRRHAEVKYDVRLDNPRFGLIVGNHENLVPEHAEEASRQLGEFLILDYDSLLQLFVGASGINPVSGSAPTT